MNLVKKSKKLKIQLLVTGNHLLKSFGETKKVIEKEGFKIDAVLPMFNENDRDDGTAMLAGMGRALVGMADIIPKLKPDLIFCGFDLGAHLAAAISGTHLNIPVSHIQGGEVSGTIDEVLRHATTKFAHVHFAATPQSAERIVRLGEDPRYVFLVGSPSLDTIKHIRYFPKNAMAQKYGFDSAKKLIIFSQHPVTTEVNDVMRQIRASVDALKTIIKKYDAEVLAIYSNSEAGGGRQLGALGETGI